MADWLNVADVTPRIAYTATASQVLFTVPFVFFEEADLKVYKNTTLLTLATDYTTAGAESPSGGTITLLTGATVGDQIMIVREVEIAQTTHIPPSGPLDIPAINIQISKLIAIAQQLDDRTDRTLHLPDSDSTLSGELASAATRQGKLLGFDTTGAIIYPLGPSFVGNTATGVAVVDSRATAQVTTFAGSVNIVRTEGLVTPGDGGGAEYIRGIISSPGAFLDGGGSQYWGFASIPGAVVDVDTRATAVASRFAANVNILNTFGLATAGDGGGASYKRGTVAGPGAFADAFGQYWEVFQSASGSGSSQRGYKSGLTLSNDGVSPNTILNITAGVATDSTNTAVMLQSSAYTKTTGAWTLGTAGGALDTGTIGAASWYHVFIIQRPDTGVSDYLFSLSPTAPTMPANYTLKRRIGSFKTSSSNIVAFNQSGNEFLWSVPTSDINTANPGTAAVLGALNVPLGVQTRAITSFAVQNTAAVRVAMLVTSPDQADTATSVGAISSMYTGLAATAGATQSQIIVRTNTSSQVRYRLDVSSATVTVFGTTFGWIDNL